MNRPLKVLKTQKKGYQTGGKHGIIYTLNYVQKRKEGKAVKHWLRKGLAAGLLMLLTAMTAVGCSARPEIILDPQGLYCLPALPEQYTELNHQIQEILSAGAEYAAPTSGTNIQPVQLVDLDGDGLEEAVGFFRNTSDEKPLKIYIFKNYGGTYQQTAVVEGSGTAIYSIAYQDMDGDGRTELLVGWRVSTDLQMLSVYALRSGQPEELLRTNYVKYTVCDLEAADRQALVVLRADEEGTGLADYYSWQQSRLALRSSARVSMTMAELSQQGRITRGYLQEQVPALFVTGVTDTAQTITDILTIRNGELTNITLSAATGVSTEVVPYSGLHPTDINNDGVTEAPVAVYLQTAESGPMLLQRIDWGNYDSLGNRSTVMSTYHDRENGWYLRLPDTWVERIYVSRTTMPEETSVTFFIRDENVGELRPFMRIWLFTGNNRAIQAARGERFVLSTQPEKIYAAELLEANASWRYGTTQEALKEAFSLIVAEWTVGDN